MIKLGFTFADVSGGNLQPHTGLLQTDIKFYRADSPTSEVTYTGFLEVG